MTAFDELVAEIAKADDPLAVRDRLRGYPRPGGAMFAGRAPIGVNPVTGQQDFLAALTGEAPQKGLTGLDRELRDLFANVPQRTTPTPPLPGQATGQMRFDFPVQGFYDTNWLDDALSAPPSSGVASQPAKKAVPKSTRLLGKIGESGIGQVAKRASSGRIGRSIAKHPNLVGFAAPVALSFLLEQPLASSRQDIAAAQALGTVRGADNPVSLGDYILSGAGTGLHMGLWAGPKGAAIMAPAGALTGLGQWLIGQATDSAPADLGQVVGEIPGVGRLLGGYTPSDVANSLPQETKDQWVQSYITSGGDESKLRMLGEDERKAIIDNPEVQGLIAQQEASNAQTDMLIAQGYGSSAEDIAAREANFSSLVGMGINPEVAFSVAYEGTPIKETVLSQGQMWDPEAVAATLSRYISPIVESQRSIQYSQPYMQAASQEYANSLAAMAQLAPYLNSQLNQQPTFSADLLLQQQQLAAQQAAAEQEALISQMLGGE